MQRRREGALVNELQAFPPALVIIVERIVILARLLSEEAPRLIRICVDATRARPSHEFERARYSGVDA